MIKIANLLPFLTILLVLFSRAGIAYEEFHTIPHLIQNELPVTTGFLQTSGDQRSLIGSWHFKADPDGIGGNNDWHSQTFNHKAWQTISVPGAWDLAAGDQYFRYQGDAWYAREIVLNESDLAQNNHLRVRFEAVFLHTTVWINGVEVGEHSGGYTPFEVDISEQAIVGANKLVLKVNNEISYTSVPAKTLAKWSEGLGWWPYGGITRDVNLIIADNTRIFKLASKTSTDATREAWDLSIQIGVFTNNSTLTLEQPLILSLFSPKGELIASSEHPIQLNSANSVSGYKAQFSLNNIEVWDHQNPQNRYLLRASLENHWVETEIGFRTVAIENGEILLNGHPLFLRGISRHEDHQHSGPVQTPTVIAEDISLLQTLNVNHIRAGHYPADSKFLRQLALAGISVTEEIPVYQLDLLQMILNYDTAEQQLIEMIERDVNEPAILIWSLGNECWQFMPTASSMFGKLADVMNEFDGSRPSTYSVLNPMSFYSWLPDFATQHVEIQSINQYFGWYYGKTTGVSNMLEHYHKKHPNKPLVISEFGAGSYLPLSDSTNTPDEESTSDHTYSPEYQSWYLQQHFDQMLAKPYVKGTMPWAFADFRMEWQQNTGKSHPVDLVNLKGLLTDDRIKKPAFNLVAEIYESIEDQ